MSEPIAIETLEEHEPMTGFRGRFVHSERMTQAYWRIAGGAVLPEHSHPQEQVVHMLEGELELVVGGAPHRLVAGQVLVIPSGTPHSGRALRDCRVLDVFSPPRDLAGFVR
jgi:quercetin dioxygenase-like cupin family protein